MAIEILVYHEDRYLAEHLKEMLKSKRLTFSVNSYIEFEAAKLFALENAGRIKCVLASQDLISALTPSDTLLIQTGRETVFSQSNTPYVVNVYQNQSAILNDLLRILRKEGMIAETQRGLGNTQLISFFSTQGGSGCSTLAYLTAISASKGKRTAYLNLEFSPSVKPLYEKKCGKAAEDFMFAVQERMNEQKLIDFFEPNEHGVFVHPILKSIQDRMEIKKEDVAYLLQIMSKSGFVDSIIVDLGKYIGEIENYVLASSERVVLVYNDDQMGIAKRESMEKDPNYTTMPFVGKELWVENKCRKVGFAAKKSGDGSEIRIRFSSSLEKGEIKSLSEVLTANADFAAACDAILAV